MSATRSSALLLLLLLGLAGGWARPAYAATVTTVFADGLTDTLVTAPTTYTLDLPLTAPGRLTITLTDLKFPALFSVLSFTLTTATQTLRSFALNGASSATWYYDVTAPATLSGVVYARPSSTAGAGMYNLSVSYVANVVAPVPLPASAWLLLSALGGALRLYRSAPRRPFGAA